MMKHSLSNLIYAYKTRIRPKQRLWNVFHPKGFTDTMTGENKTNSIQPLRLSSNVCEVEFAP